MVRNGVNAPGRFNGYAGTPFGLRTALAGYGLGLSQGHRTRFYAFQ